MHKKLFLAIDVGLVTVMAFATLTPAFAGISDKVAIVMENVRKRETVDYDIIKFSPPLETITELDKYRTDPDESVRLEALLYIKDIGLRNGELLIVQTAANSLLKIATQDKSGAVARSATTNLLDFPHAAFTEEARQSVHQMLMEKEPNTSVLLLIGIVEDQSAKARLHEFGKEMVATELDPKAGRWWGTRPWAAHLALARLGDAAKIKFCIDAVEAEKNDVIRVSRLLKDLDYIRQPATVKVLIRYLLSDGALAGSYPDVPRAPYADYALESLTKRSYEAVMADHHAREFEESFMSVSTPFVAHAQAAQVMEPGESALDNPAAFAKSTAMSNTPLGQQRFDATPPKFFSMGLRIVSAVALHRFRTLARSGRLRVLDACAGGPLYH